MRRWLVTAAVVLCSLVVAAPVSAQGALVHGAASAAVSGGHTAAAVSGGVTYRFNRALGFGVELARHFSAPGRDVSIYDCCDDQQRLTSFTTLVRLEVPTTSPRVIPFVVAGGGVAAITQSYGVIYYADLVNSLPAGFGDLSILPGPTNYEYTSTGMALTLGGGASLLLSRHLAADIDLRAVHLLQDGPSGPITVGRFGVGLSYRF